MKNLMIVTAVLLTMTATQPALASDGAHHDMNAGMHAGSQQTEHMQGDMGKSVKIKTDMYLVKKEIDGYTVSFHAMKAKETMQHGGTHHFMAKVEKDGKALTDLVVNSKVTHPNNKSESKMLIKMGDWYMAGYDLGHEGQHQLMVLFKTADGAKHFGGVYFPEKKATQGEEHKKQVTDHEQHH